MNKSFSKMLVSFLALLFLFSIIQFPVNATEKDDEGDDGKTVKVGYYENEIFEEGASECATKKGYAYEYYQKISEYTGWKYEYVYGDFNELYQQFIDGDIDIMAGLAYTDERSKLFLYPELPMGNSSYNLLKHSNDDTITTSIESLNDRKIGVVDNVMVSILKEWMHANNVNSDMVVFNNTEEMMEAFSNYELDVVLVEGTGTYGRDNVDVFLTIGKDNYYMCVSKKRQDIMKSLNEAQSLLNLEEPAYIVNLNAKYFANSVSSRAFSLPEIEWISTHNELKIGYLNNYLPYSDTDSDGNTIGLIKDIAPEMLDRLGLSQKIAISYVGYDNYESMLYDLRENNLDVVFPVGGGIYYAEENGIYQSTPIVSSTVDLVYKNEYPNKEVLTFAVNQNNKMQKYYIETNFPDSNIKYYDSIEGCLDAIKSGEADCTTINGLRCVALLKNSEYKKLNYRQLSETDYRSFGIKIGNDGLLKLINRAKNAITDQEIMNIAYNYTDELYKMSMLDYIRDHIVIFSLTALAVVLIIFILIIRDNSKKKEYLIVQEIKNKELLDAKEAQEKQVEEIKELNKKIENRMGAIQSMSKVYFTSYYIDLKNDSFEELSSIASIRSSIGTEGKAQEKLNLMCSKMIQPEFISIMQEFTDLSTIEERLKNKSVITCEYKGNIAGWCQAFFIAGDRDENGNLNHVFIATRTIHEEKEKEKRDKEITKLLSVFSEEYEAIHLADLNEGIINTLKASNVLKKDKFDKEALSYETVANTIIERYVSDIDKSDFLKYIQIDAMKKRMEKYQKFSYRYSINDPKNPNKYYEMNFFNVSDSKDEHLLVIGAKCIDDIMKTEREQVQYNEALLHDCKFFYEFDVTEGNIVDEFHISQNYDPYFGYKIELPIGYDEFNKFRHEKLGMEAVTEKENEYWTCAGLKKAFDEGKQLVELRYSSEMLNMHWRASIILTLDPTSHNLHAVYICKDITESVEQEKEQERALEKALQQAKRASAAKTEFLSRMSHDIRTPLNGIIGIMDINAKHADDIELTSANRKKARVAADHLLSLINDVLDMSRFEGERATLISEPVNIRSLCEESLMICNIRAKEKGITLKHDNGDNLTYPYVFGSKTHIKQIFMNILNNCIKYNKPNGEIRCYSNVVSKDEDNVTYKFEISDTGIGMKPEFLEHIFEPFSQEKSDARSRYQGTGIGMAIVKILTEKMGGTVEVESEEGVGSKFTFVLPFKLNKEFDKQLYTEENKEPVSISGKNILLAEDNELNMEIAKCILEDVGVNVTPAEDGQEAYEIFTNSPAGSFDAIIMDVMMPRLNGYEATIQIRKADKADAQTIPIIAMTANAFAEDRQKAMEAGMNAHVAKPIDIKKLLETLSYLIK